MKIALKTGGWLIVVAWAILVACLPGGSNSGGGTHPEYSLVVTSPTSSDTWLLGESQVIRWSADASESGLGLLVLQRFNQDVGVISYKATLPAGEMKWKAGYLANGERVKPGDYGIELRRKPGAPASIS